MTRPGRPSLHERRLHPHVLFDVSSLAPQVAAVRREEPRCAALPDAAIAAGFAALGARVRAGESEEELAVPAFALVREAARRAIGQRPFDGQVLAGLLLRQQRIIEMQTGEGKTLAAVLPASLAATAGRGVHVLTSVSYTHLTLPTIYSV